MRDQGDVPFAIRASCAIPGWYVPVMDERVDNWSTVVWWQSCRCR